MTPRVTVMQHAEVFGWPNKPCRQEDKAFVLDLSNALTRSYRTDAHCVQYASPNGRRLNKDCFAAGVSIEMTCMFFDIDDPENHGKRDADDEWRGGLRAKMAALFDAHPDPYFYETRGGARIVYLLDKPFTIATEEDALTWHQRYVVIAAYLLRRFGIAADLACSRWHRLFRLPHATRDSERGPEQLLTVGDASNIGRLVVRASVDDLEHAAESTKAFRETRKLDFTLSDGKGILFHALAARGHVLRELTGALVIQCPQNHMHSSGEVGDTSTVLYLPAAGERIGAICCLHSHCVNMTVKDWLGCFTRDELSAAEKAAGLEK